MLVGCTMYKCVIDELAFFVSRTWKIINEVVSEKDTYLMKTCATVMALKHIRGDGTMSWSGNVWGVCVTDRGGWGP